MRSAISPHFEVLFMRVALAILMSLGTAGLSTVEAMQNSIVPELSVSQAIPADTLPASTVKPRAPDTTLSRFQSTASDCNGDGTSRTHVTTLPSKPTRSSFYVRGAQCPTPPDQSQSTEQELQP
jgi:hypothetical protein